MLANDDLVQPLLLLVDVNTMSESAGEGLLLVLNSMDQLRQTTTADAIEAGPSGETLHKLTATSTFARSAAGHVRHPTIKNILGDPVSEQKLASVEGARLHDLGRPSHQSRANFALLRHYEKKSSQNQNPKR